MTDEQKADLKKLHPENLKMLSETLPDLTKLKELENLGIAVYNEYDQEAYDKKIEQERTASYLLITAVLSLKFLFSSV